MIELGVKRDTAMDYPMRDPKPAGEESYPSIYVCDAHAKLMGVAGLKEGVEYETTIRVKLKSRTVTDCDGKTCVTGTLELCAMEDWQTDEPDAKSSTERATASVMKRGEY